MSRKHLFICLAIALVGQAASAQTIAAPPQDAGKAPGSTDPKKEIAYRAALGRADDVRLLLIQGADPNSVNEQGIPILMVAAGRKDAEAANVVKALLYGGANINARDHVGQTALYYAARAGKADIVDYLLKSRIDYYSMDNNGDIARTIAFRAGHEDIVKLMDQFVRDQTLQMSNNFKPFTATPAEPTQQEKQRAEQQAREQAIKAKIEQEVQAAKDRMAQAQMLEDYKKKVAELSDKVYMISYHSCAFQYWSFCQAAKQTTELSPEELEETIDIHKVMAEEASLDVMTMFDVGHPYVEKVINPSKLRIYNALNQMPSRTWRKENGVGTLADANTRCDAIAKGWEIGKPQAPAKPAPKQAPKPAPSKAAIVNKTPYIRRK